MKQKFLHDLQTIYDFFSQQKKEQNLLFSYFEEKQYDKLKIIDEFAANLKLDINDDFRLALLNRLVNLREDSLVQVLNKNGFNEDQIDSIKLQAYDFVKNYWHKLQLQRVIFIEQNHLLDPFYRSIFRGVYETGVKFSAWQPLWTKKIILENNKELAQKFTHDDAKVMEFLTNKNLLDFGHSGEIAERCYSVLEKTKTGDYKSSAYVKSFKKEVFSIIDELEKMIDELIELEDKIYNQKWEYVLYFQQIIKALNCDKPDELVEKWADVDRAWMKITTPIQIGHPLEYYEDHYRKAVALEWDIRLSNPKMLESKRALSIKNGFEKIYQEFAQKDEYQKVYNYCISSIDKVQLYIGQPALFFGAQFNGLFSAQVVPNDEVVSFEFGKKIFAYSGNILETQRAKPFMKLSREIFGEEFVKKERRFLFQNEKDWYEIYDISTIGHEYGHILWCDENTESKMNTTGNFKNIEEFKATTGGLIAYFLDDTKDDNLREFLMIDLIKRSVGLIAWMQTDEVRPYYCEGLIHLDILFSSSVLSFDGQKIKINLENYEILKNLYLQTYKNLAKIYLDKIDANEFLKIYAQKEEKNFMPTNSEVYKFVNFYYDKYKSIGQEIDNLDSKSNYN